jgi:hypothetical protein
VVVTTLSTPTEAAIGTARIAAGCSKRDACRPLLFRRALLAEAAYLTLRGDLTLAIARYQTLMTLMPPHQNVAWMFVRAHFARALNLAGQHARAQRLLRDALARSNANEFPLAVIYLEPQCQLALAEAGRGRTTQGALIVDGLLGQYGHADNPLLVGLLHKTRAEIALLDRDTACFDRHVMETERRFRGLNNPALLASLDRLLEQATKRGLRQRKHSQAPAYLAPTESVRHTVLSMEYALTEHSVAANRHQHAMRLMVEHTRASAGYLFEFVQGTMRLVAASTPEIPPSDVHTRLEKLAVRQQFEELESAERSVLREAPASALDTVAVAPAPAELKTVVSRGPRRRRHHLLPQPHDPSEVELVTDIVSDSTRPSRLTSQADEPGQTVFVPSDRPAPGGGTHQVFLLEQPANAQSTGRRVLMTAGKRGKLDRIGSGR